jgi:DNA invertase Pin-like site-specific DNA recombinase
MRLVMYTRVSGKSQVRDGYGLSIQEKDCRSWAAANGHRIVQHCSDGGISGAAGSDAVEGIQLDDRPGIQCVVATLAAGKADGVLFGKLDRIGRELGVQEAMLAVIWRHGGHAFSADQGEILRDDPDDPMRTAMRKMVGLFAELDRLMVVKRLKDGRAAKAAAGKHATGVYPYGYRAGGEGRNRDAVPDDAEQRAVSLITRLRSGGRSYREIIQALEEEGIPPRSGRTWYPSTVRKIALRAE